MSLPQGLGSHWAAWPEPDPVSSTACWGDPSQSPGACLSSPTPPHVLDSYREVVQGDGSKRTGGSRDPQGDGLASLPEQPRLSLRLPTVLGALVSPWRGSTLEKKGLL